MSYDWTRIWWQFYGVGKQLRLFLFRAGGRLVGIVPTYIETIGLFPLRFRVARLVGAYLPPKTLDPPVDERWAEQIWLQVVHQLLLKDGCSMLSLGLLSEEYKAAEALRRDYLQGADGVRCRVLRRDVRTVYHFPATYEEYFNSLDSKERKVRRKKLRDLEAIWPLRTEVVRDPATVETEFEAFAEQHTRQWQADGRTGHFHAWPNALEFNRALVQIHGQLGRVRFFKVMAGAHVVANQYTFAFGKTLFAELPSRIVGKEWERFSLGCTSQIKLIEAAIHEGFNRMDSGLGHYEYKILTNGTESRADMIHLVAPGALNHARVALFRGLGRLLQVVLHKAWYRRIMPRLPAALRRGQSRLQLRFDF